ncbi:MAG: NPCBM/NEW2 domain-containing protein, partial [Planctomycetota bacterium]
VQAFDPKGVRFRSDLLGEVNVPFERLKTLVFAAQSGAAPTAPDGVYAVVHADDGTVVAGTIGGLTEGRLGLEATFGGELSLALDRLLRIEFRGGRLVFLSDLEPAEVRETPFFDLVWHWRRDRSVDGNPLRIGERTYRKGLGMHSRCELTYALDGGYRRFLADVGLDEEIGDKGNVDVAVLVDGKAKFERQGVTGRDAPIPVDVDVEGAKTLTLRVGFGRDFDICDHADWGHARLIR